MIFKVLSNPNLSMILSRPSWSAEGSDSPSSPSSLEQLCQCLENLIPDLVPLPGQVFLCCLHQCPAALCLHHLSLPLAPCSSSQSPRTRSILQQPPIPSSVPLCSPGRKRSPLTAPVLCLNF